MFSNITTIRTPLRSIVRVNCFQNNSRKFSFVFQKLSKLVKCPRRVLSPLCFSNGCSLSYPCQIFNGERQRVPFTLFNNLFTYTMVNISSKSAFFARQFFKMSFCGFTSFTLQSRFQFINLYSFFVHLLSRINFTSIINRKLSNPHINTKKTFTLFFGWFRNVYNRYQVKVSIFIQQVNLSPARINKSCLLIFSQNYRNNLSAFQGKNGYFFKSFPRENTLVVNNSSVFRKLMRLFKIKFFTSGNLVSISNLTNNSYRHLRRQIKFLANIVIANTMDFHNRSGLVLKSYLRNKITSLVISLNGFQECLSLLLTGDKFNFNRQLHIDTFYHILIWRSRQFLPVAKDNWVSLP